MTNDAYKAALTQAKTELATLQKRLAAILQEEDETEKRIVELRQTVAGLAGLCGEQVVPEDVLGLTDSVRQVLRTADKPQTPQDVQGALARMGFKESNYSNLLASVHTVLKRLVAQGEAAGAPVAAPVQPGTPTAGTVTKPGFKWIEK